MPSRKQICELALGLFILTFSVLAHAQTAWNYPDFCATQVFESRKANFSMKVCQSGSSVRVERNAALSTLYVPSSGQAYNFTTYPDHSQQCVAMNPDQSKMLPSPLELLQGSSVKRIAVGTEVVEGHPTKIESVFVTRPGGKTIESKVWEAEDLQGIPVKIESRIGDITLTAAYRDVSIHAPEEALFAIPEKCTPFEKMGQVAEQATLK